jgi:hypothetical protein
MEGFEASYSVVGAGLVAGEGITALVVTSITAFIGYGGFLQASYSYYKG